MPTRLLVVSLPLLLTLVNLLRLWDEATLRPGAFMLSALVAASSSRGGERCDAALQRGAALVSQHAVTLYLIPT